MVAGTGRFDTKVMAALGERVFVKVGAEGVYCAALPEVGLGVALKVDDGGTRAAEVAMAALLTRYLPMNEAEHSTVSALAFPTLRNWNGLEVGSLRPTPDSGRLGRASGPLAIVSSWLSAPPLPSPRPPS